MIKFCNRLLGYTFLTIGNAALLYVVSMLVVAMTILRIFQDIDAATQFYNAIAPMVITLCLIAGAAIAWALKGGVE